MISVESKLRGADNSGAKVLKCIKILGNFKKRYAYNGDVVLVSVKRLDSKKKIKKKNMYFALIISTKWRTRRLDGTFFSSKENRCLLLAKENRKFLGTRVYGFISKEIRSSKENLERYKKIISYARATL